MHPLSFLDSRCAPPERTEHLDIFRVKSSHRDSKRTAMVDELRPIDADNHYYESLDAFTRHLDRAFRQRGVRVVQDGSHTEILIAGRLNRFIPNPTFDPVIVPGCLDLQF